MTHNIYDLANELDRAIRLLPEYKAVEAVKVSLNSDTDAKAILDDYLGFQTELQGLMQTGQMPSADMQKRMEEIHQKVQANPLVSDYFAKQQHLSIYMSDLEKIIFRPLQDLMK
ncbi:putative transcriptional regulator [Streptococcus varani]|uniref:UPF0342 protein BN1356_01406 n=2 Tax=Bacilli TaxID=91061 RepID=A0A0E4H557_9STRE|nr:YlbF/YmcA family competence regulator [Streptococcus varani]CQR25063.1 putative transcriptional regulator [Streptococcus varani]